MTLLSISNPEDRADKPRQFAVGIDLGTTHSLAAVMDADGSRRILRGADGSAILPSVAHYAEDGTVTVGAAANARRQTDPHNTIASVKRLMGRSREEARRQTPYYLANSDGMVKLKIGRDEKSPVEISADILRVIKARALAAGGAAHIAGAVITVPAYFDDAQRQATKDAAQLAGIRVLRLLNEPTAAAVAYGLDGGEEEGVYAIYDLGGGTFDLSVLRFSRGVFEVLATKGDTALGGDDYDRALVNHIIAKAGGPPPSAESRFGLLTEARRVKEALSTAETAEFHAEGHRYVVRADAVDKSGAALTARTLQLCGEALADAGLAADEVTAAILVGGATRMPSVRAAVAEFFGGRVHDHLNPDEVVALGAAAQADVLIGNQSGSNWLLLDVVPLSLGLETMGGLSEKVIHRNETIPLTREQEFTTHQDGQSGMMIHVVQGEREVVAENRSLARFTLSGIPPMAAGLARVQVVFEVDADGLLSVTASEKTGGARATVSVKPSYGLGEDEVKRMLKDAYARASDDWRQRQWLEAKYEAEKILRLLRKALADESDAPAAGQREAIAAAVGGLEGALRRAAPETAGTEAPAAGTPSAAAAAKVKAAALDTAIREVSAAMKSAEQVSADYVTGKMNRDIASALAGKTLPEI